jgi:nucleotide-binding universal stress UspA family protein
MGKIICATRGGEASYRAQDVAIELAKERGGELVFLYVVDLHFLDKMTGASVVDVSKEMTKMGEFLLLMAQERAAEQSVSAGTLLREGRVREELEKVVAEENATTLVMGRPTGAESRFELSSLQECAAHIEAETCVTETIIV